MENKLTKKTTLANFLNMPNIQKFLDENLQAKKSQFVSNLLALANSEPLLKECDPTKLMMCAMNAASLSLPLNKNLGFSQVVPYKNGKTGEVEPQFQIGAKGFKQLAIRSGQYRTMNQIEIRENELTLDKFTGKFSFNKENPTGKVVGYFAYFELMNGYEKCLYMNLDQIEAHAKKYSKLYQKDLKNKTKYSKWSTDERVGMALKTVIKLLLSREGLLTPEMETAITHESGENDTMPTNRKVKDAEIIPQDDPGDPAENESDGNGEAEVEKIKI